MNIIPQTIGPAEIPQPKPKMRSTGQRGPGRWYLHGGELAAHARGVLESIPPDRAQVLEFEDVQALRRYAVLLHNVNRTSKSKTYRPIATKSHGLRLLVWLRNEQQLQLL